MCHDFIVIPAIRWIGHSRLLCHDSPDWLLDAERNMLSVDQCRSAPLLRYFYAEALSLQYGHDLCHHLQRPIQRSLAHLHVEPAGFTREQNAVFILAAVIPEPTCSASDQRMWASGRIDWQR